MWLQRLPLLVRDRDDADNNYHVAATMMTVMSGDCTGDGLQRQHTRLCLLLLECSSTVLIYF